MKYGEHWQRLKNNEMLGNVSSSIWISNSSHRLAVTLEVQKYLWIKQFPILKINKINPPSLCTLRARSHDRHCPVMCKNMTMSCDPYTRGPSVDDISSPHTHGFPSRARGIQFYTTNNDPARYSAVQFVKLKRVLRQFYNRYCTLLTFLSETIASTVNQD